MKNLILTIMVFSCFCSNAKTIFKIYNASTGKSVKVRRGQIMKVVTIHDNLEKFYAIMNYKNDTLYTDNSFILVSNIHTMEFNKTMLNQVLSHLQDQF